MLPWYGRRSDIKVSIHFQYNKWNSICHIRLIFLLCFEIVFPLKVFYVFMSVLLCASEGYFALGFYIRCTVDISTSHYFLPFFIFKTGLVVRLIAHYLDISLFIMSLFSSFLSSTSIVTLWSTRRVFLEFLHMLV